MSGPRFGSTNLPTLALFCVAGPQRELQPERPGIPQYPWTECPVASMCFPPGITEATLRILDDGDIDDIVARIRWLVAEGLNVHVLAPVDSADRIRSDIQVRLAPPKA